MKYVVLFSTVILTATLTACAKQPDPETGAKTEQAKNQFKQTIDTVTTKTQQATDHTASAVDQAVEQADAQIKTNTDKHQ